HGLVPAEKHSRHAEHHHISSQNISKTVSSKPLGNKNGDNIRSPCSGVSPETDRHPHSIQNSSEDRQEKHIIRKIKGRKKIHQNTGKKNGHAGKQCKVPPDK